MSLTFLFLLVSLILSYVFIVVIFFFFKLGATHFPGNLTLRPRLKLRSSRRFVITSASCWGISGKCYHIGTHLSTILSLWFCATEVMWIQTTNSHKSCPVTHSWEILFFFTWASGLRKAIFLAVPFCASGIDFLYHPECGFSAIYHETPYLEQALNLSPVHLSEREFEISGGWLIAALRVKASFGTLLPCRILDFALFWGSVYCFMLAQWWR